MKRVRLHLRDRSYNILVGRRAIERCGAEFARLNLGKDAFVISNATTRAICGKPLARALVGHGFSVRFESIPDSEKAKSLKEASRLLARLAEYGRSKKVFIIALGGGVTGDLGGFVASVYKRGIPYVQVPTTLLAQVDSAIGGKTAVDLPDAKNLVGSFYQPRTVVSDVSLIRTLPLRQVRSGMAEIIKYGIIADKPLFTRIEMDLDRLLRGDELAMEDVVLSCSRIKARIVEQDETDTKGVRTVLNLGHTIGHAVEAASAYSGRYSHGEAVAIGIAAASDISRALGIISDTDAIRIESLLEATGLPTRITGISPGKVLRAHLFDKKFEAGSNRFVLPVSIGKVAIVRGVPGKIIGNVLRARTA